MQILLNYDYPGNVRELENILEHALITCQQDTLKERHLPEYLLGPNKYYRAATPKATGRLPHPDSKERDQILAALNEHNWHRIQTARALGMDRTTLWRKMKKYGLMS
jgi:transcriptional regulator of acetoin/glycerol metabolism